MGMRGRGAELGFQMVWFVLEAGWLFVPVADGDTSLAFPEPGWDIFAQQEVKVSLPPVSETSGSEENERVVGIADGGRKARMVSEALGRAAFQSLREQQRVYNDEIRKRYYSAG
ncbi:hypothetical protein J3A83DRAFT_4220481 [Scleroderma citrinum]